ncbi:hypothetical protein [Rhodanobacter sp. MP1X3]|uniref:hypothetical protein n=1 Tax=Rhodanobacter sp. MP1X3 TaxID=2723086 RepID=UPI00160D7CB6|nr:hypothetical protein [Rhodanobacter sp. MP1X3]MBB6242140.1 hypothetical protein [Rhodanobacter sp. MP1X3]
MGEDAENRRDITHPGTFGYAWIVSTENQQAAKMALQRQLRFQIRASEYSHLASVLVSSTGMPDVSFHKAPHCLHRMR